MQSVLELGWSRRPPPSVGERDQAGDRPGEGGHFPGDGHHDLIGVLAARGQLPVPLAQAHLAFQPIACTSAGSFSSRSCRWRLTFAG